MTIRMYIITIAVPSSRTRPFQAHEPEVFIDRARAIIRFQHIAGSNVSVVAEPGQPTVSEHWKTKVLTRFDTFDISA